MTARAYLLNCTIRLRAILRTGLFLALALDPGALLAAPPQRTLLYKQAPAIVRMDLNGKPVNLRSYRGRVVLLNFWATWCGPCQIELPRFAAWEREYGPEGLQVIAVSMDDAAAPVRMRVQKLQLDFPVVMGDEKLGAAYGGVLGLPVTFLIARDGTVRARIEGASDLQAMEQKIRQLLSEH